MGKKVTVIKANSELQKDKKIRVGVYCRISSDSGDNVNSFLAQMQYYSDFISSNPNMIFIDLYADEGITGTSIKKRPEFKRMLQDCENNKLDRILVKSVTRFARNSLECIDSVRKMKSHGVSVFFENDNIDTANMNSEMMLYIKSAFAQSEATTDAKRMRTSVHMRMEEGIYKNGSVTYGYKFDGNNFVIVDEEAKRVKEIYELYLTGYGYDSIAKVLNEKYNDICFTVIRIKNILENEKYIGDCLFGKFYTPEIFPFSKKKNRGESDKFYCKGTHEPIISKEIFDKVQEIRKKRSCRYYRSKSNNLLFQGMIYCRHCGWLYKPRIHNNICYWYCSKKGYLDNRCESPTYKTMDIEKAFVKMYNILKANEKYLIDESINQIEFLKTKINIVNKDIKDIDAELVAMNEKNNMYANLYSKGIINDEIYYSNKNEIDNTIKDLKIKRKSFTKDIQGENVVEQFINIKNIIEKNNYITMFNVDIFNKLIKKIYIEETGEISFILKNNLELPVKIEENICVLGA